jgi:hypothetical protein
MQGLSGQLFPTETKQLISFHPKHPKAYLSPNQNLQLTYCTRIQASFAPHHTLQKEQLNFAQHAPKHTEQL